MERKDLPQWTRPFSFRGWILITVLVICLAAWAGFGAASCHYTHEVEKAKDAGLQSSVDVTANSVQAEQDASQAPIVITYKADNAAVTAQLEGLKDDIAKLPPSASSDVDADLTRVILVGLCRDKARGDSPDCRPYRENTR